jgi:MFS family permease
MCPSLSMQAGFFYNKKLVFAVAAIVIFLITADMIISSFYDVLTSTLLPNEIEFQISNFVLAEITTIILFVVITVITYGVGWPFFSALIDKARKSLRKSPMPFFEQSSKALTLIKYIIIAILGLLVIEMLIFSYYHTILLILATVVTFIPASMILSMLCYNLLSWYRSNMQRYVVLLYALSTAMVAIAIGLNAAIYSGLLLQKPDIISLSQLEEDVHFTEISASTAGWAGALYFVGWIPFLLGFMLVWGGSVFLLRDFSYKIGKVRLWLIVSLPLAAYLIAIVPTMTLISENRFVFDDPSLLSFRILFKSAVVVGGLFFGMIFFVIARTIEQIPQTRAVIAYVGVAGLGITMLTILLASPVYHATYPPFGASSSSFVVFASYMVSIGFYYSAVSVSQDVRLRRDIRALATSDTQFLDSIAYSQMEREIKQRAFDVAKKLQHELTEQTGIQSTLNDKDIASYLEQVIEEVRRGRKSTHTMRQKNDQDREDGQSNSEPT